MPFEIPFTAYVFGLSAVGTATALSAASILRFARKLPLPSLRIKSHAEKHRGIRVIDIGLALSWPKPKRKTAAAKATGLEFAVYVTIRSA